LTPQKAKEKRALLIWPDFVSHCFLLLTALSLGPLRFKQITHRDNPMKCSRSEFFTAIQGWRESSCAVHLHTDEISGAFVVTFRSASKQGVLEFSAHPLLQPLTVDLSNANQFEFVLPEHEIKGADSSLVKQVADEIALARVGGKLVFSMTRLVDPFAGRLVHVPSRLSPKSDAATAEPPIEPEDC
jgi:hypothetical protein